MPVNFVEPKVYFQGFTTVNMPEVVRYLQDTGQMEFLNDWQDAMDQGLSPAEALCSMYAKLCYKSLVEGKNANISKTRGIKDNIAGCFGHGHGSVFEHVNFNFLITDCSRIFTHELVRHRVGTAFSQTSGRYCRPVPNEHTGEPEIDFVHDPILDGYKGFVQTALDQSLLQYDEMVKLMDLDNMPMKERKKVTSALRRILPNGQANEIAVAFNIRTIRHLVQNRTSSHAEWEIRLVFAEVYRMISEQFPMVFHGAKETVIDGIIEVSGMKMQPYDLVLSEVSNADLVEEMKRRGLLPDKSK